MILVVPGVLVVRISLCGVSGGCVLHDSELVCFLSVMDASCSMFSVCVLGVFVFTD